MGGGYFGYQIPKYRSLDGKTSFETFRYHQPGMRGGMRPTGYNNRPRWQYWWMWNRPPRNAHHSKSRSTPVVYSGNPKGSTAICLVFIGIFCIISGLFMSGFGYTTYSTQSPLRIIGPLVLGLGVAMILVGAVLCIIVSQEECSHPDDSPATPGMVVSASEDKHLMTPPSPSAVRSPLSHLTSINGTSITINSSPNLTRTSRFPPSSPDNGHPHCQTCVVITPPEGASSPKAVRLPFQAVGPAFRLDEKDLRAASMERLNEIDQGKKNVGQLDDITIELEERENRRSQIMMEKRNGQT